MTIDEKINIKFNSKEELLKHLEENDLYFLDSEYSPSTRALVKTFNANGANLTRWWVMTSPDWKCPSCNRDKSQIVRKNKHNDLICHLHEHHDHVSDLVKRRFTEISSSRRVVLADHISEKFVERLAYGFSSYDSTVICFDCNAADADAKKIVNAPKEFSFSPQDISKFIIAKKNAAHEINERIAQQIWAAKQSQLVLRTNLIDQIAEIAAANENWYESSNITARQLERKARAHLDNYGITKFDFYMFDTLYKPVAYEKDSTKWRYGRKRKHTNKPSESEIKHMIQTERGKHWKRVEDTWKCPVCNRSKMNCTQKSKKQNLWSFIIQYKNFYNPNNPDWAENHQVCNECAITAINIQHEIVAGGELPAGDYSLIKFDELKKAIIPQENTNHIIHNDYVDELCKTLNRRYENKEYSYSSFSQNQEPYYSPLFEDE